MFVTYSDLIQIGIFIVTLVGLCYTVFGKRTVPAITIIVGTVKTQFGYHLIKVEKKMRRPRFHLRRQNRESDRTLCSRSRMWLIRQRWKR